MVAKAKGLVLGNLKKVFRILVEFGKIQPILIAVCCWSIIILGSWVHDFHRPPECYFSNKNNIFNVLFVKRSLGWTLAFLGPYIALSSFRKSNNDFKVALKNVSRLFVVFVVWFVVTSILDGILDLTGDCEGSNFYSTRLECLREELIWQGFDISGHAFLLTYLALTISEEIHDLWMDEQSSGQWEPMSGFYRKASNVLHICCCLLMVLWMLMLLFTALYFHTVESKVVGVMLGLFAWYFTYGLLFKSELFPVLAKNV